MLTCVSHYTHQAKMMTSETGDETLWNGRRKLVPCPSLSLSLFLLVKDLWRVFQVKQTSGSMSLGEQVRVPVSKPCLMARMQKKKSENMCVCMRTCVWHVCVYMYTLDLLIPMLRVCWLSPLHAWTTSLCTSNSFKARGTTSRRTSFQLRTSKREFKGVLCLCLNSTVVLNLKVKLFCSFLVCVSATCALSQRVLRQLSDMVATSVPPEGVDSIIKHIAVPLASPDSPGIVCWLQILGRA